jgi:hypothetical protein
MPKLKTVDFARLTDWMEGRLAEEEAAAVEKQLATADETTLADVAWLRMFVEASQRVVLPAPPPGAHENLVRRFKVHAGERQRPGRRKRIVARLTFDSGRWPAVAEVRKADTGDVGRQLVYSADTLDVALDILPRDPEESRLDLEGQLFPNHEDAEPDLFDVRLLRGEQKFGMTITDDLGEFTFEAVPPGVYEMLLSTDKYDIVVAPVQLGV